MDFASHNQNDYTQNYGDQFNADGVEMQGDKQGMQNFEDGQPQEETSSASSDQEGLDYAQLMNPDDTIHTKGEPTKGRCYFIYICTVMIILTGYLLLFGQIEHPVDNQNQNQQ